MKDMAEDAANLGEMGTFDMMTRQLCESGIKQTTRVKDQDGKTLRTERKQADRWVHHFSRF